MIILESAKTVNTDKYDEVWYIVRSTKQLKPAVFTNSKVKHMPALAPSNRLFFQYVNWRNKGQWNRPRFDWDYVPAFLSEMKQQLPHDTLQTLAELSHYKNIALVCFCSDESMCHRSIVGGILANMGADICCSEEYRKYDI